MKSKLKLHGFNNLTKTLSFNIYDICYAETPEDLQAYVQYIDEVYDAAVVQPGDVGRLPHGASDRPAPASGAL